MGSTRLFPYELKRSLIMWPNKALSYDVRNRICLQAWVDASKPLAHGAGEPILNRGFQNWNYLVLNMIEWLKGGPPVAEFGMRGASET